VLDAFAYYSRLDRTKLISIDLTISRYAGSQIKFQLIAGQCGHYSDKFFATQFLALLTLKHISPFLPNFKNSKYLKLMHMYKRYVYAHLIDTHKRRLFPIP
jgi:hypothetical protein